MHFGLSLIFAWNLHQKFSVAAKYSKFAGGSLNKVWSPFSLSKKQFIFWLKFRKIVDYFHILQPNHQVKQSCPTPFQENWIGGWFGSTMVTTKSRSQQGFWEPSDLFKGKSDTAIAEKYREFCCKFQQNWTRISMLWKRKYRWTHLQSNITTSCIACAVIFSPPSFPATTCFQCWELFLLATAAIGERVWLSRNMFVSCSSTRPTIHFQIYWLKMNAIWGQIFFIWKFFLFLNRSKVRRCGKIQCFRPKVGSLVSSLLSCLVLSLQLAFKLETLSNSLLAFYSFSFWDFSHDFVFVSFLSLCICVFLSLCICVFLSLCLCVFLSLCLFVFVSFFLTLSLLTLSNI